MTPVRWLQTIAADSGLGFSLLRIYLGIGLLVRGAIFVSEPDVLLGYLKTSDQWFVALAVSHYVAAAHLCGGILLALGLGTRIAAALQVPVLFGAVFFVHFGEGLLTAGQSLEFSALVLCMLVVYSVFGGGKLSLDAVLEQRADADGDLEPESARPATPSRLHLS